VILQEGHGRLVELEPDGATVRKSFPGLPDAEACEAAAAELDRLERFAAALDRVPDAVCPAPLGLVDQPAPGLRMSRLEGESLVDVLTGRPLADLQLDRFGTLIAAALDAYVKATGEPYHDLKFDNVLVAGDGLGFFDLGMPQHWEPADPAHSPHEVSLGNLLASALFEIARPRHVLRLRLRRQASTLARGVVSATLASGIPLDTTHLVAATDAAYVRATYRAGGLVRKAWYGTVAYATAPRLRIAGATIAPVVVWRRR